MTLLAAALASLLPAAASAEVDVALRISTYFTLPHADVEVHLRAGTPAEDVGRAYFVAAEAGVPVSQVLVLRTRGWGWGRICNHHGVAVLVCDDAWKNCKSGKGKYVRRAKKAKPHPGKGKGKGRARGA